MPNLVANGSSVDCLVNLNQIIVLAFYKDVYVMLHISWFFYVVFYREVTLLLFLFLYAFRTTDRSIHSMAEAYIFI